MKPARKKPAFVGLFLDRYEVVAIRLCFWFGYEVVQRYEVVAIQFSSTVYRFEEISKHCPGL